MKNITLFSFFLFCLSANIYAQQEAMIYLKNGSQIKGQIKTNDSESTITLLLSDGNVLYFEKSQIKHIDDRPDENIFFENGHHILSKGTYKSFDIQYMTANYAAEWQEGKRTGIGASFSMGHQFKHWFGIGAGAGFDWHEQFMAPVFGEIYGLLPHKIFSLKKEGIKGYQIPISYSLQVGHNFQLNEWISDPNEFEEIKGGWMIYPSLGLAFPSRDNNTIRFDMGYKFQRYTRTYEWDWSPDYTQVDKVTLKSLTFRAGLVF